MRVKCTNKAINEGRCDCPEDDCVRHGICCECIAYHRTNTQLPQCCR